MQHRAQIDAARTSDGKYDYSPCFSLVKEEISRADIAIGNLEVTLGGKPYQGYPTFSAPDEYLQAIKDAEFDVLLTANNHCLDRGKTGLERTITQIESFSIPYAGTYRNAIERKQLYPLFIRKKGFCIAILNYTYGTNGIKVSAPNIVNYIDKKTILKDIHSAQAVRPDAIIACMHWGEEYQSLPNREQCELADWLLKQGVTHIIGSHPHVIQPMELRTNGLLRDGRARVVAGAADLLAALGLHTRQAAPAAAKQPAPLSDTERRVLAGIGPKPVGIEELCVSTGLPMSALLGTLMKLELTGRVYKQPGQRYVLR